MGEQTLRPIVFMGDSKKRLRTFPEAVRRFFGYELHSLQRGQSPGSAKSLKGIPGVAELAKRFDTDTYRAVYIANIEETTFVLHCFKKKSHKGVATPGQDIDLVKQRLAEAKALAERYKHGRPD